MRTQEIEYLGTKRKKPDQLPGQDKRSLPKSKLRKMLTQYLAP